MRQVYSTKTSAYFSSGSGKDESYQTSKLCRDIRRRLEGGGRLILQTELSVYRFEGANVISSNNGDIRIEADSPEELSRVKLSLGLEEKTRNTIE